MRERTIRTRDLQYFLSLARDLHSSNVPPGAPPSHPTLASAIAVLERELGGAAGDGTGAMASVAEAAVARSDRPSTEHRLSSPPDGRDGQAASCNNGALRVAWTDSVSSVALDRLRVRSHREDPGIGLRMYALPLAQQIRGLHDDLLDIGFSLSPFSDGVLHCIPLWRDQMIATVPASHPLAREKRLALKEIVWHPLVLCDPDDSGIGPESLLWRMRAMGLRPEVAECVTCLQLMRTLVAAGFGLGISSDPHLHDPDNRDLVTRPVADWPRSPTTYLLYRPERSSAAARRYIDRALKMSNDRGKPGRPPTSCSDPARTE